MADGSGSFLAAAQQGSFTIDQASAQEMIKSIEKMQTELDKSLDSLDALRVQAKLGDLPEAQAISALNTQVASSRDNQSMEEALHRFADELEEARQGLELAMHSYAKADNHAEQGLGRMAR